MNVCCNKRLASLQPHIKGDSGISPGSKSIVTRVSMDALDSTNGDPTNSKEIPRNIALLVLILTLGLVAARQMYCQKRQSPASHEFGLPSGSKPNPAPCQPVDTPQRP